ncbi:MAG: class I SAM-dependent DNA methyltransferase [Alistipes sp.]|nr:class I SAM-dependent DNA methyltransferase [Alistipes sp.]
MALSWNEIKERAIAFSKKWEDTTDENADAKPFLIDFFNIFGVSDRRVNSFEHRVTKRNGRNGYIDMLWKGNILIEMKSRGKDLDRAYQQATDYFDGLKEYDLPKYILVCDFHTFRLYDLEADKTFEFTLDQLYKRVNLFGFIAGYSSKVELKEQDPVNIKAAEAMAKLHDSLKEIGYDGHDLELYLVRLLFCLFADDSSIFNKNIFYDYVRNHSAEDGSNLASAINELFEILNTPTDKRLKNISDELNAFPYVNGKLFEERLPLASFDSKMRKIVLECCALDWGKISPAIFGSMFQGVMDTDKRRNLGAHYTSEKNILKLIKPLFLDELWAEFEKVKNNERQLKIFHQKISSLRFLDPACGCGNFLIVTYRELRLLELEVLKALNGTQRVFNIADLVMCNVDQFAGIEYEEFPAQIAKVAMWLIDHQMNMLCSAEFGEYFVRLPLRKSANIIQGDALELDWNEVAPKEQLSYIIGNPPFVGARLMSKEQSAQIERVFDHIRGAGNLDYVTAWYAKAAQYIQGTRIKVAFVSTNSIVQGEQVGILWRVLLEKYNVHIHFAHRTFKWSNEAKGNAGVYCVIIGFANFDTDNKTIFEYEDITGEPHQLRAKNINPYLVDAKNTLIENRSKPLCDVPTIGIGNKPIDGGNYLFTKEEMEEFIELEPKSAQYFRPWYGAVEFIQQKPRYCLWLGDCSPSELRTMPHCMERVKNVREFRLASKSEGTRKIAETPTRFHVENIPQTSYILIPRVSSENRKYIPMGFVEQSTLTSDSCVILPDGNPYHFGVLTSAMHMAWTNAVCGRLESRFRYSAGIVYNNFPWVENPSPKQVERIEQCAEAVLEARKQFPNSSLADLYDPLAMPPALMKAHQALDKAVDAAYRSAPFTSDSQRMEFLFDLYNKYNATLFDSKKKKK